MDARAHDAAAASELQQRVPLQEVATLCGLGELPPALMQEK